MAEDKPEIRAIIDHLFEGRSTVEALIEAFTIEHEFEGKRFTSTVELSLGPNDDLWIMGQFICTNALPMIAGTFFRRFYRKSNLLRVHHANIAVVPTHRHHYIATTHYLKLIRYYDRVGVLSISLEANQDGPTIWPQFGLSLIEQGQRNRYEHIVRKMLAEYLSPQTIEELMAATQSFTPLLARIAVDPIGGGDPVPVGLLAMRALYEELGEELRMVAWLDLPKVRAFLAEDDILPERGEAQ